MRRAYLAAGWVALVAVACDDGQEVVGAPQVVTAPEVGPAADYARYCALCHGPEGEGYAADNANMLANQDWLAAADDDFIISAIANGRPGTPMSAWSVAWGGPMTPREIEDLAGYIRDWQLPETATVALTGLGDPGEVSRGEPIYAARCADCHGRFGEGTTAVSLNNPQFLYDVTDGYLADAILRGRAGTAMMGYAEDLTEQSVADLIALLRSWQADVPPPSQVVVEHDLTQAAINPTGPDPVFTIQGDRFVSVADVAAQVANGAKVIIADARAPGDYAAEHITGAVSIPFYAAADAVDVLPRDTWTVTYCGCPHAASSALTDALRREGYTRVVVLDEGFFVWRDGGYPTTEGVEP